MTTKSVNVPIEFQSIFSTAEKHVKNYFSKISMNPEKGVIEIEGERYILVRAASMSIHFLKFVAEIYPSLDSVDAFNAAAKMLFDIARVIGKNDAQKFHKGMNLVDPISKLSTGPCHFSYSGWAFVNISSKSSPTPDENYYLIYDHPQSFEADSWIAAGEKTTQCVCHMNAGYSSGWCEESFNIDLVARELFCRAKGDPSCRFIMAQPHRLEEMVQNYLNNPEF